MKPQPSGGLPFKRQFQGIAGIFERIEGFSSVREDGDHHVAAAVQIDADRPTIGVAVFDDVDEQFLENQVQVVKRGDGEPLLRGKTSDITDKPGKIAQSTIQYHLHVPDHDRCLFNKIGGNPAESRRVDVRFVIFGDGARNSPSSPNRPPNLYMR